MKLRRIFTASIILSLLTFCVDNSECTEFHLDLTIDSLLDNIRIFAQSSASKCANHLEYLIINRRDALIKMLDAWSKHIHNDFTLTDYGNFDECVSIDIENGPNGDRILGKHCASGVIVPNNDTGTILYEKRALCIPESCTKSDICELITTQIPSINSATCDAMIIDRLCATKMSNQDLSTGAIISILIFSIFAIMIFFSTTYDIYLYIYGLKPYHQICIAFSLLTNGKKLLKVSKSTNKEGQITCFHGIKVFSIMWIIAGHGAVGWRSIPLNNYQMGVDWIHYRYMFYVNSAHLAVDTFFFISGFLVAYSYFKSQYRKSVLKQISLVPEMIVHRYLRLTPALLMLFLYAAFLSIHFGNGPIFNGTKSLVEPCTKHWWSIFLYIQNYYNRKELCMTQLWYVSADMQLFLISPIIFIPTAVIFRFNRKMCYIAMVIFNLVLIAMTITVKLVAKDYDPNLEEYDTHSRLPVYFMGFLFGMFVRSEFKKYRKIPRILNVTMWILTLILLLAMAYLYQESIISPSYTKQALGLSLTRIFWCIGLCWIVYSCLLGQGGIINWILSNRFMQTCGQLTYSMYLVHGNIVAPWILTLRSNLYLTDFNAFYSWCGHFILSLLIAIIWVLSFELPMIEVDRLLFTGKHVQQPKKVIEAELKSV